MSATAPVRSAPCWVAVLSWCDNLVTCAHAHAMRVVLQRTGAKALHPVQLPPPLPIVLRAAIDDETTTCLPAALRALHALLVRTA